MCTTSFSLKVKGLKRVTEQFIERNDKLEERTIDFITGYVVEKFGHGRGKHLKGHFLEEEMNSSTKPSLK
jgi:hypothetical protein